MASARNGRDYRDYWLGLVDEAGILAIAIEFPKRHSPNTSGTISAICTTRSGTPNPREQWTYGIDERLFAALRAQG